MASAEGTQQGAERIVWDKALSGVVFLLGAAWKYVDWNRSSWTNIGSCLLVMCFVHVAFMYCIRYTVNSKTNWQYFIIFTLLVAGAGLILYDNLYKVLGTPSQDSCWQEVEYRAGELSLDLDVWNTNMLDAFTANGLISPARRNELFLEMTEKLEKRGDRNAVILRNFHFRLLTEELPKRGDEGFMFFCRILRSKSNFSAIGTELCRTCNLCRSELLNETTDSESGFLAVHSPPSCGSALMSVGRQAERPVAKFVIDSFCKNHFKGREKAIRSSLLMMGVEMTVHRDSDDGAASESPTVATQNSSLVCGRSGISATLSVQGIYPTEIDHKGLQRSLAKATGVQGNTEQVQLHSVSVKGGSLVLLRLSPNSGFELLCLFNNSRRLKQFAQSLGTVFHSALNRTMVHVQVSELQPFEVMVEPCGGFSCPGKPILDIGLLELVVYFASCALVFCVGFVLGRKRIERQWRVQGNQTKNNPRSASEQLITSESHAVEESSEANRSADGTQRVNTNNGSETTRNNGGSQIETSRSCAEPVDRHRTLTGTDACHHQDESLLQQVSDREQQSGEATTYDRECRKGDIRKIYKKISCRYRQIGRSLELPDYEIERIDSIAQSSNEDKCYSILQYWVDMKAKSATVFCLFDKLVEADCPMDAIEASGIEEPLIRQWKSKRVP